MRSRMTLSSACTARSASSVSGLTISATSLAAIPLARLANAAAAQPRTRDAIGFDAKRFANLAGFGHAGRAEREGEHLVRRFRVAGDRDEVERRIGAERRELALGLEADQVGQLVGRSRRQRQELHLHVVAADADERRHFAGDLARRCRG